MSERKVTSTKGLEPCPRCGNRHAFVAVSQQVMEDCCEVWLRCGSCGHEPDSDHRREDVWGSLDAGTVQCLGWDWNCWVQETAAIVAGGGNAMTTHVDYRALCAELVDELEKQANYIHRVEGDDPTGHPHADRARALFNAAPATEAVDGICTGCDTPRHEAIAAVAKGGIACCPDCSTLTVADRNAIRELLARFAHPAPVPVGERLPGESAPPE